MFLAPLLATADDWEPLQFLIGQWTGQGTGSPGNGAGRFSFTPDLQGHILIRKSFAEYPAAGGKPGYRHDDLLIVYRDGAERQWRAIYFDNEAHVIRYTVAASAKEAVFTSDGTKAEARYRMTYRAAEGTDRLGFRFEVAAPGKELTPYIDAVMRREAPGQ